MLISCLARSVFVALAATIGDYIWFEFGVRHTAMHGVLHGAGLLLAVGLVMGQQSGHWIKGAIGGIVAGVVGAIAYYAIAPGLGYLGGLIGAWIIMWMVLAGVSAWVRGYVADLPKWVPLGLLAAVGSGIAFYFVSGIWTEPPRGFTRNYLWHLAAWTIAWAPGITALTWSRRTT